MNWPERQTLVTGGAGFIGSHLVQHLLSLGARVRVLDNLSTGLRSNLDLFLDQVEFVEGDIRDPEVCSRATGGCDVVFHQAALGSVPRSVAQPAETMAVNIQGSTQLFTAAVANSVRRIVYASSSSVYGDLTESPKIEGQEGKPLSPYAASKAAVESIAYGFNNCYQTELFGLRYFNVFGPRQNPEGPYAAVIPRFLAAARRNELLTIFGDGLQTRDFTYIDDVVNANLLAADTDSLTVANISGGTATSVLDLSGEILRLTDSSSEIHHKPPREGDVRHSLASLDHARAILGYSSQYSLQSGLARTIDRVSSRSNA